ncbi:MAG: hypothetical protein FWE53_03010 [Firmicutes bacterium]|nr:hypothetical protein [Bacillota bacterium]
MQEVIAILQELSAESSTLKKKEILRKNEDNQTLRKIIDFLLNPFIITGISAKKIKKELPSANEPSRFGDFLSLLDYVAKFNTGTDQAVGQVQQFINAAPADERDFYRSIITKSLRLGSDAKTVNSVWGPDFIPQWEVQQSYRIDNYELGAGEWFSLSEKLNGVRGTYYENRIFSRQGKEFNGLDHILSDIKQLSLGGAVLDGELVRRNIDNVNDNENFRLGTGIINSDSTDKTLIEFVIFDCLSADEFKAGKSNCGYKERLVQLKSIEQEIKDKGLNSIAIVKILYSGTEQEKIPGLLEQVAGQDKEGLMLNRDMPYQRKRHNGILKVKKFYTVDLKIVAVEAGGGRLAGTLGAFVVEYKDNLVNVGSGFSDEQRSEFWAKKEELIGRVIEVKYKEESVDKKTKKHSLQFPIFVALREEGKEVSYS